MSLRSVEFSTKLGKLHCQRPTVLCRVHCAVYGFNCAVKDLLCCLEGSLCFVGARCTVLGLLRCVGIRCTLWGVSCTI
jgi:hypothetical protein